MSSPSDPPSSGPPAPAGDVTALLRAAARGETLAAEELLPLIYAQLRALAQKYMHGERSDHTLNATALVHEAYLRLVQNEHIDWQGRAHFYFAAAGAMRRVLVDHARSRGAVKRRANLNAMTLNLADLAAGRGLDELLVVDEALDELAGIDARAAAVVRIRFFAGLSVHDTARMLKLSPRTVDRDWEYARAWLKKRLSEETPESAS